MKIDLLNLIDRAKSLRPNTKRGYANVVRQWLAFAGDDTAGWTVAACQGFYDHLLETGIAPETANNMVTGGLAFAFRRAAALYHIPDITAAVDKAKVLEGTDGAAEPRHALTSPQAKALLETCSGSRLVDLRDRAVIVLGLYTGMRRMSLVDVDLTRVRELPGLVLLNVILKGGRRYDVPLDARAWKLTEGYRKALAKLRPVAGPMFPALPGPRLRPGRGTVQEIANHAISEDGLYKSLKNRSANFHPHLFRHTFSTWCRSAKIEDFLIEVVTGHKSNRGLVDRVYTDRPALHAEVVARCYEAVSQRLV